MPGLTNPQEIPYPEFNDPVNVHADMQAMAQKINDLLTALQVPYLSLNVKNASGESLPAGTPVFINGYNVTPTVGKSIASDLTTFPVIGLVKTILADTESGVIVISGTLENVNTAAYSEGDFLYVSSSGGLTSTRPTAGSSVVAVVTHSDATAGVLVVGPIKGGNATWGSLKDGI